MARTLENTLLMQFQNLLRKSYNNSIRYALLVLPFSQSRKIQNRYGSNAFIERVLNAYKIHKSTLTYSAQQ